MTRIPLLSVKRHYDVNFTWNSGAFQMWMYSLGRALLDTTPRVAALTGTVSVSPSSALQSVLAAMTEPDPRRRASLMNLLDVISEYCRTRLQTKPFTHIVMDMYREVVKSPQYTARKRIAYQHLNPPVPPIRSPSDLTEQNRRQTNYPHHHHHHHQQQQQPSQQSDPLQCMHSQAKNLHQDRQYHSTNQYNLPRPSRQRSPARYQLQEAAQQTQIGPKAHHHHHYHHHHPAKGALFKLQSRNSHSHPNLTTLCGQQQSQPCRRSQETEDRRTQFHSQLNVQQTTTTARSLGPAIQHQRRHHHSRTYSQPIYTRLQHTRSSGNLSSAIVDEGNPSGNVCNDPIYALPVKPFLSSQDVRVNGLSVKPPVGHRNEDLYTTATIARRPSAAGYSHPDIPTSSTERGREEIYGRCAGRANPTLQRQHSNPQLPSRDQQEGDFGRLPEQSVTTTDHRCPAGAGNREEQEEQTMQQQNPVSSMRVRSVQGPPKPPRIITTLKKAPFSDAESSKSEPPAKPPRNLVKNGPRARRGKAVQRAPSRLYRTVGVPTRSFNKAQCVGPEFVVRANQPSKTLCVGQVKASNSGRIVVIMLTGQRVEVTCDPQKVTAGDLFQAIMQAESLDENFTLGLAVLLAGDFAILPPDTKLNKVAPPGWLSSGKNKGLLGLPTSFMLYLRLRFFLPSLRGVRSWISKHLLYLQIRRCILEQQLVCPYPELINLTGLALQAEFGNYNVNEHGCGDYFLLEHYVPESLILNIDQHQSQINNGGADVLRARLHQAHRDRRGLDSNKAEEMFITHAQTLPDYGSHYYIATVDSKELEKVMAQQRKRKSLDQRDTSEGLLDSTENIYKQDGRQEYLRGRIEISRLGSCENIRKIPYDERKPAGLTKSATSNDIYGAHRSKYLEACNNNNVNNVNNNNNNNNNNKLNHDGKSGKSRKKKTESNVWLAIHAQGLKLFERGGEPRERMKLAQFQWKDIQTLNYSKSCLVVCSKVNGKRCKFKLRMDHRK
ncbi:hypothetical protein K0M31_007931 [Melipona bicolor]|uniref:FERM domain-containing protein n=1 Tax=Melipona bicolor TaxID=60889 RepID=A0AA40GCL3_9HYME|nr:hypothetical protein K0M31_007931 [Melipona bicolor]